MKHTVFTATAALAARHDASPSAAPSAGSSAGSSAPSSGAKARRKAAPRPKVLGDAPQSAAVAHLRHMRPDHPARDLTPQRLARLMDAAEAGDWSAQAALFEDMEEKDAHIACELGKRRRACLLPWHIAPPPNPTPGEEAAARQLCALCAHLPDLHDVVFDLTDAIGKGFVCLELHWQCVQGRWWLPLAITHRPQSWFLPAQQPAAQPTAGTSAGTSAGTFAGVHPRLDDPAALLRLNTGRVGEDGMQGDPLRPLGWLVHTHLAKSGTLARGALMRQLMWPFLLKAHGLGFLAQFLEIYGIPMRIGRYSANATEEDRRKLQQALSSIGRSAAGIIPEGMGLEFVDAARGDPAAFELLISWCEKSQSKAILGGTLTSGADGKTSTHALGEIHNEVRHDLRDADLRQISAALTRGLLEPIARVNGLIAPTERSPQFILQARQAQDVASWAAALPALVTLGVRPSVQWVHETLGIPEPEPGQPRLGDPQGSTDARKDEGKDARKDEGKDEGKDDDGQDGSDDAPPRRTAAATARAVGQEGGQAGGQAGGQEGTQSGGVRRHRADPIARMVQQLQRVHEGPGQAWLDSLHAMVQSARSLEEVRDGLQEIYGSLSLDDWAHHMAQALQAAHLLGRSSILDEAARDGWSIPAAPGGQV